MAKFTDEQLKEMRRLKTEEHLAAPAIAKRMNEKFSGLAIKVWQIYACLAPTKKAGKPAQKKTSKRGGARATRKADGAVAPDGGADRLHELVNVLVAECAAYTEFQFRRARAEIIRHVALTRKKRIAAGENIEEYDDAA